MSGRATGPIVVGGTGGSGTRMVTQMLRSAGVDMGTWLNASEDALAFVSLYDTYVDPFLRREPVDRAEFSQRLGVAMAAHRGAREGEPWGWKNPRSIFLLPLLDQIVPGLRFVHVIRHGLDMALSDNQNQLAAHGRSLLGPLGDTVPGPLASALLWKKVNLAAAEYGASMDGRYFLVRYEDACHLPAVTLAPVLDALSLAPPPGGWPPMAQAAPGRWRNLDPALIETMRDEIGDALQRFGYEC
jgi:hypothetical protein